MCITGIYHKYFIKWKDELWKTFLYVITFILCFSRNVKILLSASVSKEPSHAPMFQMNGVQ